MLVDGRQINPNTLLVIFLKLRVFGVHSASSYLCNSSKNSSFPSNKTDITLEMLSTPSYFNFQPLNPSLSFPNDLITIPIAISTWATLHFLLSKTLFQFIEEKVYKFKSEIDRLKYKTAGKLCVLLCVAVERVMLQR